MTAFGSARSSPLRCVLLVAGIVMSLGAPAQPGPSGIAPPSGGVAVVDLKSLPETIGIEHADRKNRFNRLAAMVGIQAPRVDEMQLASGQVPSFDHPVPVVRVQFDERTFFDFDKDVVRHDSEKVLDLIAENMKRDVPDAQLTILGHTDAIGTDAYNSDLSRRRASSVMQALISRGCNAGQMSTVAVGKMQPIAPNSTEEGRARNRRVEFMLSASEQANLSLVARRRIVKEYFIVNPRGSRAPVEAARLEVLKPVAHADPTGNTAVQLRPIGIVEGRRPRSQAEVAKLAPMPDIKQMKPKEYEQARLNREFEL